MEKSKQNLRTLDPDLQGVDIYAGVREFNILQLDRNVGNRITPERIEKASRLTGLEVVCNHVLDVLGDVADNIMLEYSLLSSTLDPSSKDKLVCCSAILTEDKSFKEQIEQYYTPCINRVNEEKGLSIYQHPAFLYSIFYDNIQHVSFRDSSTQGKVDKGSDSDTYFSANNAMRFLNAFTLHRPFVEMVRAAKNRYEEKKGDKKELVDDLKDTIGTLHGYCHANITQRGGASNRQSCYIAFPIIGAKACNQLKDFSVSQDGIQGVGACFIYLELKDHVNEGSIRSIVNDLYEWMGDFIRFISANYIFNLGLQLQENAKKEAVKSAISAIMSRNMSHNLGSHYLYYTKAQLESLANESGEKGPDIRGAAKVMGYMQARMDYLATIISNDKYPNGAVNFKSQLYDELTIDDFSKRHFSKEKDKPRRTTNFLLSNLIMSENFSRSNIYDEVSRVDSGHMPLILQSIYVDAGKCSVFTGTSLSNIEAKKIAKEKNIDEDSIPTLKTEEDVKNILANVNLALPGGSMSCHAFFNVLENFIRNSAKYLQSDFQSEGLVISIAIRRNLEDKTKYDIIIFDNKKNANKLLPSSDGKSQTLIGDINNKLENLRVLDYDNSIEKSSKGLKEMLFSTVWMRTYMYPDESYADIICKINSADNGKPKMDLIKKYGFSLVPVTVCNGDLVMSYDAPDANLGLLFTLPEYQTIASLNISETDSENERVKKSLGTYADMIEFSMPSGSCLQADYVNFFTRSFCSGDFDEIAYQQFKENSNVVSENDELSRSVFKFKSLLDKRFKREIQELRTSEQETLDIDSFHLVIDNVIEGDIETRENRIVYFKRHLSTKDKISDYKNYPYADSVSGGNFTITIDSLLKKGLDDDGRYQKWEDRLFGLKVKESALTRITLIDERLYNNMMSSGVDKQQELSCKNIRVLNFSSKDGEVCSISDMLVGNQFRDSSNRTNFLSIHLGLIEKIVKNENAVKNFQWENVKLEDRVRSLMQMLYSEFGADGEHVFISVHSGRGNFSAELEGPLSSYPFISLAAIESAYSNSKYLLSQLFYNTIYIGKGRINKKDK